MRPQRGRELSPQPRLNSLASQAKQRSTSGNDTGDSVRMGNGSDTTISRVRTRRQRRHRRLSTVRTAPTRAPRVRSNSRTARRRVCEPPPRAPLHCPCLPLSLQPDSQGADACKPPGPDPPWRTAPPLAPSGVDEDGEREPDLGGVLTPEDRLHRAGGPRRTPVGGRDAGGARRCRWACPARRGRGRGVLCPLEAIPRGRGRG